MRKPNLCFFQHVIKKIDFYSSEIIMIDNTFENVCVVRFQNKQALLINKLLSSVDEILRNLFQNSLQLSGTGSEI